MNILPALEALSVPDDHWKSVPEGLFSRYAKALPLVARHKEAGCWFVHPERGEVSQFPDSDPGWVMFKGAGVLEGPAKLWSAAQKPFGGPTPLSSTLLGGALGAGVGYGTGFLLDKMMPDEYFEKNRWRKTLGTMGAMAGTMPGLYWGLKQYSPVPDGSGRETFQDRGAGWTSQYPFNENPTLAPAGAKSPPISGSVRGLFHKRSDESLGAAFLPSIPVDAFNNVVWNDVATAPNRFGTKSPWGDNEQSLGTPPAVAAATSGLLYATSLASGGRPAVSPMEVAKTVAMSSGGGLLGGLLLGKVLGTLAGLRPEAQSALQRAGLWGGLLTGVVNSVFR